MDSTTRRILILGWSAKIPALLREFATYRAERWEVDIFSQVDAERRSRLLARYGGNGHGGEGEGGDDRVIVRHLEGDFTVRDGVDPLGYDGIVLPGGDSHRSGAEADARPILGALLLQEAVEAGAGRATIPPGIVVELLDPGNRSLLDRGRIGRVDEQRINS